MSSEGQSFEDFKAEKSLADRLAQERQDARRRSDIAELKRLTTIENHRQDALQIIRDMSVMIEPPKLRDDLPKAPSVAPLHTNVYMTSDWQMGQWCKLGATGGMYQQTSEITARQIYQMWSTIEERHTINSAAKRYDEAVLMDLGDLCDGDQLRVSQAAFVDAPVTRQAIEVLDLESWLITKALERFPKVRLLKVGGNHDRTSAKAGNAGLGELGYTDTYSWLIGEFLKRLFSRSIDEGRLEIVNHESFFGTAMIAGRRWVYEHGSSFKASTGSYGGISFYSLVNAARGYREMLDGADVVAFAHHHKAMVLPMNGGWGWHIMNGALPPSSPYIQSNFKGYIRPIQLEIEMHEDKGLTDWAPIYLEQPEHVRPGNFWKEQHGSEVA